MCRRAPTLFLFLVTIVSVGLACQTSESADKEAISQVWSQYIEAILNDEGQRASALVTASTIEYYGDMRKVALNADEAYTKQLTFADRVIVLQLRHQLRRAQLEGMNPIDLFAYTVNRGWVGKESVTKLRLGEPTVSKSFAAAPIGAVGPLGPFKLQFRKEGGQWKLDITSLKVVGDSAVKQVLSQQRGAKRC